MKVYFLSGLGADKTVFQFLDLKYCEPIFISWIKPFHNEILSSYALRLKDFYKIPDDAIICGLSFGGMLATELAKEFSSLKVILISSAKTKYEMPPFYRVGKYFSMHNFAPAPIQRWFMLNIKFFFGLTTPIYIKVYEELIKNSDIDFNKWAVTALVNWNNTHIPGNITHIHGTTDKILPYKYVKCNHTIKQGGHLMIMEQASLISKLLQDIILNGSVLSSSANQSVRQHQA
jgi:pimeloyl-ACP methyl ester carboxylesterase